MTTRERLERIGELVREDPGVWDVITSLRGPDRGQGLVASERPCDGSGERERYPARVARKMRTVAVLRGKAFGSCPGARVRYADHVVLPPEREWDHFDKHVARAALTLGLKVITKELTDGE